MGWNLTLTSDKEITFEEVNEIVNGLPDYLGFFGYKPTLNEWGWSAATDISKPTGNELGISGSYGISADKARPMMKYLKSQLESNGHKIIVSGDIGVGEIIEDDTNTGNVVKENSDNTLHLFDPKEFKEFERKMIENQRREQVEGLTLEEKVDFFNGVMDKTRVINGNKMSVLLDMRKAIL